MNLKPVWKESYCIGAFDTDTKALIKLSHLTGYIQESAWRHASHLNFGSDYLHKNNLVWVLSAIKIHIDSFPGWSEKITIETWPRGLNKFFYLRDFVLYDQQDNLFGIASTQWLLIDIKSKRPKIVETEELLKVKDENKMVFEESIDRLPKIDAGEEFTRFIDYNDYDLNQHVNSNRYVDFILGTFPFEFHKLNMVSDFQLNFLKEVKDIDKIIIQRQQINNENLFLIEGLSIDKKITYFQSIVRFKHLE